MPSLGQSHLHLCLNLLNLGHLSHCFHRVLTGRCLHAPFFFARSPQQACMWIIFTSVMEEFVRPPEFVLVSTIVSIGPVRTTWSLGVTLLYYFRFLFVTCENYSGKTGKLAYQDLTLARLQHQYGIMPERNYASTPLRHYAIRPLCHYVIMPVHHYASMPLRNYASTPCYLNCINPNSPSIRSIGAEHKASCGALGGHFRRRRPWLWQLGCQLCFVLRLLKNAIKTLKLVVC